MSQKREVGTRSFVGSQPRATPSTLPFDQNEMEHERRRENVRGLRRLQRETGRTRSSVEVSRGPPAESISQKKIKKGGFCKEIPCFHRDRRGLSFQILDSKGVICRF